MHHSTGQTGASWTSNLGSKAFRSIAMCLAAGLLFCGAQPSQKHLLVVEEDAMHCTDALTESSLYRRGDSLVLRPDYQDHYRVEAPSGSSTTWAAMWDAAYALWRKADFDGALARSAEAPDAILAQPVFGVDPHLHAVMQLRITILLLQGKSPQADLESVRLLSRGTAEYYCSNKDFPEACVHLGIVEDSHPLYWPDPGDALVRLSNFSAAQDRTLSLVSSTPDRLRLTLVELGDRSHAQVWEEDCTHPEFWSTMLADWEQFILAPPALRPPPLPRKAIALERTLRIGVPIAATLAVGAAIGTTVLMHQRREHFDRCAANPAVCPHEDAINDAFRGWLRARAWTAVSWTAVGAIGLSTIPLAVFKKRAIRRAERSDLEDASR